jgi:hypothetical protein
MTVAAVEFDAASTSAFLELRRAIYRSDANWIAPLDATVRSQLSPAYPFYLQPGNRQRRFVATEGGRMVGHVLAQVNAALRDEDGAPVGTIGFFDCIEDYPVAAALLDSAVHWLRREQGLHRVWGPLDFDIWHDYRFMVRGFAEPAFYGEPRNPPYYPEYFQRYGFTVRKRWTSLQVADRGAIEDIMARHAAKYPAVLSAGYRIVPLARAQDADMRALYATQMAAFAGFLGYTHCPFEEYAALFPSHVRVLDLRFVSLLTAPQGSVAAFSIAYPDIADAMRAMRGRSDWMARLRFLLRRRRSRRIIYHSVGVHPAHRAGRGYGDTLVYATLARLLAAGFDNVIFALIADTSGGRGVIGPAIERAQREYALFQLYL